MNKSQDEIIYEVVETLRILNYPVPKDDPEYTNWQNGFFNAEKKIIYPVFYFLLTQYNENRKRI